MSISRSRCYLMALLVTGACAGDNQSPVAALEVPSVRNTLQRVDDRGAVERPIDVWMGTGLSEVLRVRVTDRQGHPMAGVAVRFAVGVDGGHLRVSDTAVVVMSDVNGIASVGDWTFPIRDTVVVGHRAVAQLVVGDTESVHFAARAWRDLSRFGGDRPLVLDRLPIERRLVTAIRPLGTFTADDALPSADAMLELRAVGTTAVHAVAEGLITELDATNGRVTMRVRDQVRVRLGGMALRSDLWVGRVLTAGETIGTVVATGVNAGVAMQVLDATVNRTRWVHPERYGARRHAMFFVRYLADSVRSDAYALVRRASPDLEGRIDYDRDGRLVGTWFDTAAPAISNGAVSAGAPEASSLNASIQASDVDPSASLAPMAMTFAYDAERPGQVRIAVGGAVAGALGLRGVSAVAWEDPDPAEVDVTRGMVAYQLYRTDDAARMGRAERVLLVQLVDRGTLRAEVVSASGNDAMAFSSRAITLIR